MKTITESPRLRIRQFTAEEEPLFLQIENDERLTQYILRRSPRESRALFASMLQSYRNNEVLGRWGAFDRFNGEFIGVGLLAPGTYDATCIELGYRLHQKYWGRGLASELARALVEYGLLRLDLKEIVAVVDPENLASKVVLQKAGFEQDGEVYWYDKQLPFYKVSKGKYQDCSAVI